MHDIVIRNGLLITPDGIVAADLGIDGETIVAIGEGLEARDTLDAAGCYVLPGGVDQHVHLQLALGGRVSTDSFESGTVAAALGGTTTVVDFVTPEPEQPMMEALAARRAEADGRVAIDYGLHMTVPTWHAADPARLAEIPAALEAGCATFKMYQAYPNMILDDAALLGAMTAVARAGGSVVLHSETGPLLDVLRAQALAAGRTAAIEHERTRPARLEATAIQRAAEIARLAGCRLLIFHVGNAPAVEAIAAARRSGVEIWGESCPQYLALNAEDHLGGADGNLYICAPPLRARAEQQALWHALADGVLQVISTDHCPWTRAEKSQPDFTLVPGGVPSIEARLALVHHLGVRAHQVSLARWVEICCTEPARLMGLEKKGTLVPGKDADLVLFDPNRRKTLSKAPGKSTLHEACDWTPYEGLAVVGWPRTVLLRGRVVVLQEQYVGSAGDGRYVARRPG